jgi:hypothetical protein
MGNTPVANLARCSVLVIQALLSSLLLSAAAQAPCLAGEPSPANPLSFPAAPRNQAELDRRLAELRQEYEPYLRSRAPALDIRKRQAMPKSWLSRMEEVYPRKARNEATREIQQKQPWLPERAPAWWKEDLDETGWEPVDLPEWRSNDAKRDPEPVIWYRTRFTAPRLAEGQRAFLHLGGVDWRAQVWVNGAFVGDHTFYYEETMFDVTAVLRETNLIAIRLLGNFQEDFAFVGHLLPVGDPMTTRYVPGDRKESMKAYHKMGYLGGAYTGHGIFRPVSLITTGAVRVNRIFARGEPATGEARFAVEFDAASAGTWEVELAVLPENGAGDADEKWWTLRQEVSLKPGLTRHEFRLACPRARAWEPDAPFLYRCRVKVRRGDAVVDGADALFGFRSFAVADGSEKVGHRGQYLLNGRPIYLRGTNLQGVNAFVMWEERENLIKVLLMMKAAYFNAARMIQHVPWPEVRETMDRLGLLSQVDQGGGLRGAATPESRLRGAGTVARVCFNNPGVVLLSFRNEAGSGGSPEQCQAVWDVDPQRVLIPITGRWFHPSDEYLLEHATRIVSAMHDYEGWVWGTTSEREVLAEKLRTVGIRERGEQGATDGARLCQTFLRKAGLMLHIGEYGCEGQDAYETLQNYPEHFGPPPPPTSPKLWEHSVMQGIGKPGNYHYDQMMRGKPAKTMAEMIAASQRNQAESYSERARGYRLGSEYYCGSMQFHFMDVLPASWPKSIVSHDFRPKQAYYELAQCNQPVAPLFTCVKPTLWHRKFYTRPIEREPLFADARPAIVLWVDNDLPVPVGGCRLRWRLSNDQGLNLAGEAEVPAVAPVWSARVAEIGLDQILAGTETAILALELSDRQGRLVSRYERELYLKPLLTSSGTGANSSDAWEGRKDRP